MSLFKRQDSANWYFKFRFAGREISESARTESKQLARIAERARRRELEESYNGVQVEQKKNRVQTVGEVAESYKDAYLTRNPRSGVYVTYAIRHIKEHLSARLIGSIDAASVENFQIVRLKEKASAKTINEEVGVLLRVLGPRGDNIRGQLKRRKKLKLTVPKGPGKAFSLAEKDRMVGASSKSRSFHIRLALELAQNLGTRAAEVRETQWSQFDLRANLYTTGKGKTSEGEGRTIPIIGELLRAVEVHRAAYEKKFGSIRPEWYVFPFGRPGKMDPARPVTTLKTAWHTVRQKAGAKGRWHDHRHTLITELAESGAGDQTIMDIAGHVSPQMLRHYSHVRTRAKREAMAAVERSRENLREEQGHQSDDEPATFD